MTESQDFPFPRSAVLGAAHDAGLLSEDEFEAMLAFAREVESQPVREYLKHGPISGGPKQLDPDVLVQARVELRAATATVDHQRVAVDEAELLQCQKMRDWMRAGVPMQFIADAVGYKDRSQVYYAVNERLPRLRREHEYRQQLLQESGGR